MAILTEIWGFKPGQMVKVTAHFSDGKNVKNKVGTVIQIKRDEQGPAVGVRFTGEKGVHWWRNPRTLEHFDPKADLEAWLNQ